MKKTYAALAATITAVALGACASPPATQDRVEPSLEASMATVATAAQIALPLDAYLPTAAENEQFRLAFERAIKDCAARYDTTTTIPGPDNPTPTQANARRYGLVDINEAMAHGYRLPAGPEADDRDWEPTDREAAVLTGEPTGASTATGGSKVPSGGCLNEVQLALGGEPTVDPAALANESYTRSERDSRVLAAVGEWSQCMSMRGYDYEDVWEPNDQDWPTPVTQEERDVAIADTKCRADTNLTGIWMAVEAAHQQQMLVEEPALKEQLEAWEQRRLAATQRILTQG